MEKQACENCKFRLKYDANPGSFLGRLWRWHANWCPGWKKYLQAMPAERRAELVDRYKMGTKFRS